MFLRTSWASLKNARGVGRKIHTQGSSRRKLIWKKVWNLFHLFTVIGKNVLFEFTFNSIIFNEISSIQTLNRFFKCKRWLSGNCAFCHDYNEVSNVCLTHIVIKILFTNEEAKKVVKHAFKVNKSSVKKDNDTDPKTHIFAILLFQWKAY